MIPTLRSERVRCEPLVNLLLCQDMHVLELDQPCSPCCPSRFRLAPCPRVNRRSGILTLDLSLGADFLFFGGIWRPSCVAC